MKLQKTTLILLGLAVTLGSFVYFSEVKNTNQPLAIQNERREIFDFQEADIKQLTIEIDGKTLEFERINRNNSSNWQMLKPENTPANDGVVVFLLNLLARGKSERSFNVSANNLNLYGLQPFNTVITILLNNRQKHQLVLGKSDFENKLIYALADPTDLAKEDVEIILISKNFQYAILERTLDDWKRSQEKKNTGS